MTLVANPRRIALEAIAEAIRPPPEINLLKWAQANMVFPAGEARPGPYDRSSFVYFDEMLKALGPDDPGPHRHPHGVAQIGKTVLGNVFALGAATVGRGTSWLIHPTIEGAARWSRMKSSPLMRSIPSVAAAFPQRARDAADAILYKERRDGLRRCSYRARTARPRCPGHRAVLARRRSREMGGERRRRSRGSGRQPRPSVRVRENLQDQHAADLSALQDHRNFLAGQPGAAARPVPALPAHARARMGQLPFRATRRSLFRVSELRRRNL